MNICSLTLCNLAKAIKEKKISVSEVVKACFARIDQVEPQIQALLTQDRENALALAAKMDAEGPNQDLPLWGVPVTIKDALSTKNLRTTAASRILENFVPFYDAFVVERMKAAGAIILAKNNMDEFAMGSSTENSAFQKTRNPWKLNHVPGGSSGGSAASVASEECFASLGSDTGGSIRQPAAFCGCVGLKPTYGRVSRYGLFAFASSLDQVGPITKTVHDAAQVLQVIAGYDARDNTSANLEVPDYMSHIDNMPAGKVLTGVKIGFPQDCFSHGISMEVENACNKIMHLAQNMGAKIVDVDLPDPAIASATYYIIAMAEASSNLARYDGVRYGRRANGVTTLDELYLKSRSEGFGQEVKRRIMLGSYVLSSGYYDAYFRKAAQARRIIFNKYQEALENCDIIIMPVAPVTAWKLDAHALNPIQAYLMDAFTLPVNLAGLPSLSLPVEIGAESGLPVGVQLIGKNFKEADLLLYGSVLEKELAFNEKPQFLAE